MVILLYPSIVLLKLLVYQNEILKILCMKTLWITFNPCDEFFSNVNCHTTEYTPVGGRVVNR